MEQSKLGRVTQPLPDPKDLLTAEQTWQSYRDSLFALLGEDAEQNGGDTHLKGDESLLLLDAMNKELVQVADLQTNFVTHLNQLVRAVLTTRAREQERNRFQRMLHLGLTSLSTFVSYDYRDEHVFLMVSWDGVRDFAFHITDKVQSIFRDQPPITEHEQMPILRGLSIGFQAIASRRSEARKQSGGLSRFWHR